MTGPIPDAAVKAAMTAYHYATTRCTKNSCPGVADCVYADGYVDRWFEEMLAAAAPLLAAAALARAAATLRAADLDDWPGGRYGDVAGCRDRAVAIVERLLADELERATPDGGTDG